MALSGNLVGEGVGTLSSGMRKLSDIAAARKVPQWVVDYISYDSENVAPLDAMMTRIKGPKTVRQASYTHLENDSLPIYAEVSGAHNNSTTTINVTAGHGNRFRINELVKNTRTEEILRITNVAANALTVATRPVGGSSAAAMNDLDVLKLLAMADTEGNTAPTAISSEPNIKTNYTQTAKVSIFLSGRDLESENYGGEELARLFKDAGERLNTQIERSLLFGGLSATDPTMTGGFEYWISTNVTNAAGALTEATLNTWIKNCTRKNYQVKNVVVFAGETIVDAIDGFGRDTIHTTPKDTVAGVAVSRYQNSFGEIALKRHGLLTVDTYDAGKAFFINLDKVAKVEFANRGYRIFRNVETPGTDGRQDLLMTDFGLWLATEKAHGILKGVTG